MSETEKKRITMACLLLLLTGIVNIAIMARERYASSPIAVPIIPLKKGIWQGVPHPIPSDQWESANIAMSRRYTPDNGFPVYVLITKTIAEYHPPPICYQAVGWKTMETIKFASSSGKIKLAGFRGKSENREILVYYGFLVGDRIIEDGFKRKLYEIRNRLKYGRYTHYLIEVTVAYQQKDYDAAHRRISEFLTLIEPDLLESSSGLSSMTSP